MALPNQSITIVSSSVHAGLDAYENVAEKKQSGLILLLEKVGECESWRNPIMIVFIIQQLYKNILRIML